MEYRWDGEQGAPFLAFRRWYNSFDALRDVVITPEKLTELMFHGIHPLEHLRAFMEYMRGTEGIADRLRQKWELKETNELMGYAFDDFIRKVAECLVKGQSSFEVEILSAYLEMEMRRALGEEVVDRILQSAASG